MTWRVATTSAAPKTTTTNRTVGRRLKPLLNDADFYGRNPLKKKSRPQERWLFGLVVRRIGGSII